MSTPLLRTLFGQVELRLVASPRRAPRKACRPMSCCRSWMSCWACPGFGLRDPIGVLRSAPRKDFWSLFNLPSLLLH